MNGGGGGGCQHSEVAMKSGKKHRFCSAWRKGKALSLSLTEGRVPVRCHRSRERMNRD